MLVWTRLAVLRTLASRPAHLHRPDGLKVMKDADLDVMRGPQRSEWVALSRGRRVAYAVVGTLLLLLALAIASVDLQARRTGMIDMAIMGGALAGGGFLAYSAIIGKEQRKVRR